MKLALSITALQSILVGEMLAALAPPDSLWQPFYCEKLQVEWKLATNRAPPTVTIYRAAPASFSPSVISNAMRLASFTSSNRSRSFIVPRGAILFQSQDEKRSLSIGPSDGLVVIYAPDDYRPPYVFENVPDKARAYELGTNILKQLELPPGELQTRDDQQPRSLFGAGTFTHRGVSQRNSMHVSFGRQLESIACDGEELWIEFGAKEKINQLELHWHGVQAVKRYPVATEDQMTTWIKEGRACVFDAAVTGARWIEPKEIKRLTIRGITLHYSAAAFLSGDGEEKTADRLYPYAILDTEAELGAGDTETMPLLCPVTREGLPPASHVSRGFGVLRSEQYEKSKRTPSNGPSEQ